MPTGAEVRVTWLSTEEGGQPLAVGETQETHSLLELLENLLSCMHLILSLSQYFRLRASRAVRYSICAVWSTWWLQIQWANMFWDPPAFLTVVSLLGLEQQPRELFRIQHRVLIDTAIGVSCVSGGTQQADPWKWIHAWSFASCCYGAWTKWDYCFFSPRRAKPSAHIFQERCAICHLDSRNTDGHIIFFFPEVCVCVRKSFQWAFKIFGRKWPKMHSYLHRFC